MKNTILALVLSFFSLKASAAVVDLLGCQEITQSKSAYHIKVSKLSVNPESKLTATVRFNVNPTPVITFNNCAGNEDSLRCSDAGSKSDLVTFQVPIQPEITVARLSRVLPTGIAVNSFICE